MNKVQLSLMIAAYSYKQHHEVSKDLNLWRNTATMACCQNASCDVAWFHATNAPRKSCRGNLDRQE